MKTFHRPCPGVSSFPSCSIDAKGLPLANKALPLVYFRASSNVHSEFADGLDSGNMIGWSFHSPILVRIFGVKAPPIVERPIKIVGFTYSTTSASDLYCLPALSCLEKYNLWSANLSPLSSVTRPFVSTSQKHSFACCSVSPSRTKNSTICFATPTPALPAPRNTARCPFTGIPVRFTALTIPAITTAPVPWISSLKQVYFSRYLSRAGNGFLKSSN